METSFFENQRRRFRVWWSTPPTIRERSAGAAVGGIAFLWIGVFGRIGLGPLPASFATVAGWAVASAVLGALLGVRFPKLVILVLFPLTTLGGSWT